MVEQLAQLQDQIIEIWNNERNKTIGILTNEEEQDFLTSKNCKLCGEKFTFNGNNIFILYCPT